MTLHKACKQFARLNQQVSSFHTLKSINKQNTCLFVTHNRVSWQQTIIKWTAFLVTLRIYKSLIDFWKKTQSQLEEKIVLGLRYGLILSFTRHLYKHISVLQYCIVLSFVFLFRFHKIQYMSVKTFACRTSHVITTILNLYMIKSLFTIEWMR